MKCKDCGRYAKYLKKKMCPKCYAHKCIIVKTIGTQKFQVSVPEGEKEQASKIVEKEVERIYKKMLK